MIYNRSKDKDINVYIKILMCLSYRYAWSCPTNELDWQQRSAILMCKSPLDYHCILTENGNVKEICFRTIYINSEKCPILDFNNTSITSQVCRGICPNTGYQTNELYKYPACFGGKTLGYSTILPTVTYTTPESGLKSQTSLNNESSSNSKEYRFSPTSNYQTTDAQMTVPDSKLNLIFVISGVVVVLMLIFFDMILLTYMHQRRANETDDLDQREDDNASHQSLQMGRDLNQTMETLPNNTYEDILIVVEGRSHTTNMITTGVQKQTHIKQQINEISLSNEHAVQIFENDILSTAGAHISGEDGDNHYDHLKR